ncbi:MAG: ABC transporter ATP-binding protein [Acidiferrobacteraceae bacterium]|nr:ABC transporter ATP-binding protein [Acidiferrobacteraceae bacterium]MBT3638672.1 ABC transporter ATP-binding protein [Acidiferrobacteraceae bacterium]MBT3972781.1 ABC transporter ATP-binding protein [Acidiferrobacteraceae bacterium]MBT4393782.1 ABC transporter ATP-binding protein [Acidiferrobacteraceae bacterium]MBT4405353.1 ABC transporter ATP-binding protein [Acidiferrobacteraceae bacterium]
MQMKDLVIEADIDGEWKSIVNGLSLDLHKGEIVGLIGESGAGKSTLGLAAMGYTKPGCRIASGSIRLNQEELVGASHSRLREIRGNQVSYVAQSAAAAFNPAHRLIDQFTESPVQHGKMRPDEAAKRGRELYRQLDLPDPDQIGERFPHQVSGGQLQRAMTAMAMGCDPQLIVFDEPTTALDVTTQIEVLSAIKEAVRARGVAAIYITHDLAVVAQMADRIMVLRYGDLIEEGNARELLRDPKQEYTKRLLEVRSLREQKEGETGQDLILEVTSVTARYPQADEEVLKDISIKVPRGKTVAVVGESGSGKSTLARVITGLLPPRQGSVAFQGNRLPQVLRARSKDQLRAIQMVYQMPDVALNPRQKVSEVIGRPLEFYLGLGGEEKRARVAQLLLQIELPLDYVDRYPGQLSGGEKQRVCIARALAANPDLIICDEVTSALDQLVAEGILELLQNLQNELGVSYLFITHDLATVRAIADHIVVMYQGQVIEQGLKEQILTPPHAPYTELLLSSVPEMDPDWLDVLVERRRRGELPTSASLA